MSTKAWDKGDGPLQPGPAGLLDLFRRKRRGPVADPPGAALFDMDGLLVDSEPIWTVAEERVSKALGGQFTPELKALMIGKRIDLAVAILLEGLDTPKSLGADPLEVGQMLMTEMAELLADHVPLQPGAKVLLDELEAAKVPMALVSSSYRLLVDAALKSVGQHRFAVSIAGDEVTHGKPDPEPYLTAARALGVVPARCVVLEDAPAGMTSAVAAGCACVYVPTFPSDEALPERVVTKTSLKDVDLALLARLAVHPASAHQTARPAAG